MLNLKEITPDVFGIEEVPSHPKRDRQAIHYVFLQNGVGNMMVNLGKDFDPNNFILDDIFFYIYTGNPNEEDIHWRNMFPDKITTCFTTNAADFHQGISCNDLIKLRRYDDDLPDIGNYDIRFIQVYFGYSNTGNVYMSLLVQNPISSTHPEYADSGIYFAVARETKKKESSGFPTLELTEAPEFGKDMMDNSDPEVRSRKIHGFYRAMRINGFIAPLPGFEEDEEVIKRKYPNRSECDERPNEERIKDIIRVFLKALDLTQEEYNMLVANIYKTATDSLTCSCGEKTCGGESGNDKLKETSDQLKCAADLSKETGVPIVTAVHESSKTSEERDSVLNAIDKCTNRMKEEKERTGESQIPDPNDFETTPYIVSEKYMREHAGTAYVFKTILISPYFVYDWCVKKYLDEMRARTDPCLPIREIRTFSDWLDETNIDECIFNQIKSMNIDGDEIIKTLKQKADAMKEGFPDLIKITVDHVVVYLFSEKGGQYYVQTEPKFDEIRKFYKSNGVGIENVNINIYNDIVALTDRIHSRLHELADIHDMIATNLISPIECDALEETTEDENVGENREESKEVQIIQEFDTIILNPDMIYLDAMKKYLDEIERLDEDDRHPGNFRDYFTRRSNVVMYLVENVRANNPVNGNDFIREYFAASASRSDGIDVKISVKKLIITYFPMDKIAPYVADKYAVIFNKDYYDYYGVSSIGTFNLIRNQYRDMVKDNLLNMISENVAWDELEENTLRLKHVPTKYLESFDIPRDEKESEPTPCVELDLVMINISNICYDLIMEFLVDTESNDSDMEPLTFVEWFKKITENDQISIRIINMISTSIVESNSEGVGDSVRRVIEARINGKGFYNAKTKFPITIKSLGFVYMDDKFITPFIRNKVYDVARAHSHRGKKIIDQFKKDNINGCRVLHTVEYRIRNLLSQLFHIDTTMNWKNAMTLRTFQQRHVDYFEIGKVPLEVHFNSDTLFIDWVIGMYEVNLNFMTNSVDKKKRSSYFTNLLKQKIAYEKFYTSIYAIINRHLKEMNSEYIKEFLEKELMTRVVTVMPIANPVSIHKLIQERLPMHKMLLYVQSHPAIQMIENLNDFMYIYSQFESKVVKWFKSVFKYNDLQNVQLESLKSIPEKYVEEFKIEVEEDE